MMIQIKRNMLVAIDEMKLKASSPIIMVIKGAQMMIKAEKIQGGYVLKLAQTN